MKTILFCGGGSAGHVIPNIAIIEELRGIYNCKYIGTGGIEKKICLENGVEFYELAAPKLIRGKFLKNLSIPFRLYKSVKRAGELLDEIRPSLIFSKGGFAALPPVLAAKKRNIPVITHESDLEPGLTTKIIAKRCVRVLTSFPSTAKKFKNGIFTGPPIRGSAIKANRAAALEKMGLDLRPTVLVAGGGSGSKAINGAVREILFDLCKYVNVLHLCGQGNRTEHNIYGYKQIEFTQNMGGVYSCADAAVARCGSNTAFELIANRIPTLFIPLDNGASRGDQIKNAEYFKAARLCNVLYEKDLTPTGLKEGIMQTLKDGKIKAALDKTIIKNGTQNIISEIRRLIQ